MNISPVNILKTNNIFKNNSSKNFKLKNLGFDTVSFGSESRNQRVDDAVSLGYEIYFNMLRKSNFNALKHVARKERNAQILPLNELKKINPNSSNYCAFFSCEYDDKIKPYDLKLFINDSPKTISSTTKLTYAMEVAHEYTHLKQTTDETDADFLRNLCDGDSEYLTLLNGFSGAVFAMFDNNIQAKTVMNTLSAQDIGSVFKYGQITPAEKNINKDDFLTLNGFKNQDEFNKIFNGIYDKIYERVFDEIDKNTAYIDPKVKDAFMSFLAQDGSLNKLKSDCRKYCAFLAQTEFEAYAVESKLAKKVMQTDKTLNIDAFAIYYDLLGKALNH